MSCVNKWCQPHQFDNLDCPSVLRKEQRAEEKDSEALRLKEIHILMHLTL